MTEALAIQRCKFLWEFLPFTNCYFTLCHFVLLMLLPGEKLTRLHCFLQRVMASSISHWLEIIEQINVSSKKFQESIEERDSLHSQNNFQDWELFLLICLQRQHSSEEKIKAETYLNWVSINPSVFLSLFSHLYLFLRWTISHKIIQLFWEQNNNFHDKSVVPITQSDK